MSKLARYVRNRRSYAFGFTLIEIAFTMIGTLMLALAFSSVIVLQSQMENLALARLTAFRRAAHGSQSITNLMRDGAEVLEHNSFNPMTITSPLAPGSSLDNREYTFTPTVDNPLQWRDDRIGSEAYYRVYWDESAGILWLESDFGQDGAVDKTFPVARGVIHCEARLGVNPEPSDPSGSLAEPSEYCVFEVGVTVTQGERESTIWVSSGAYPRDPVQ